MEHTEDTENGRSVFRVFRVFRGQSGWGEIDHEEFQGGRMGSPGLSDRGAAGSRRG